MNIYPMNIHDKIVSQYGANMLRKSALNIRGGAGVFEKFLGSGKYKTVLEIGTYRGVSAAEIAQYVDKVITIDLHFGKIERNGATFDRQAFWKSLGVENIELHLVHDDAEKERLVKTLKFDFAFIDGAHDESVRNDFEMVKHCGAVLFHDADDNTKRGFKQSHSNHVFEFLCTLPQHEIEFIDIFCLWKAS